jgi:PPOX class probable FMN-dependent enzyme
MMDNNEWMKDQVTSLEQIRDLIDKPHEAIVMKNIAMMDSHVRNYLKLSPLFFLATSDVNSRTDVSPRGDKPGFVRVLDDNRLTFPDRPGNRRTDSLINMMDNPQMGMIFIIPGLDEVLRINGRAIITRNEAFIAEHDWKGKTTGLAVVVEVEECFIHCPRAFKQAGLWNAETWIPKDEQPSVMDMFRAHLLINGYTETDE